MDTKNILPRITASIHCPVIKLEKILFARFHTCARYLTGFPGTLRTLLFYLLQELFFLQKDIAGEYKANGYIHCSSQKSHGDGHCGGNNVIDSVLQYAEYRIDYFPGSMSRDCAHFTTSGLFPNTLSIHFWKPEYFLLSFCYVYECCPQFRYYYQHNDHDYTDHKADRKHQADRSCQFWAVFSLVSGLFRTDDVL